jgi:hypothetical protein
MSSSSFSKHGHRVVVSLLSPSLAASYRAQEALLPLLGWRAMEHADQVTTDWDQVAMECPTSGTVLQWLSLPNSSNGRHPFQLLAVQESPSRHDAMQHLNTSLEATTSTTRMKIKRFLWQPVTSQDLLGGQGLPLIQWTDETLVAAPTKAAGGDAPQVVGGETSTLKEVAIPIHDNATYADGRTTLRQLLGASPLGRPATGLYQFANGLCIRPLPTSADDRQLSLPTLVFHHEDLDNLSVEPPQETATDSSPSSPRDVHKIGYNGTGKGQIMVRSADWAGVDVRFCEQRKYRSGFAEAQEALLGGSLPSLQSQHVLEGAKGTIDPKTDKMDCWVEFRATLRNPMGYVSTRTGPRVAKAPDLPYQ